MNGKRNPKQENENYKEWGVGVKKQSSICAHPGI
jgi:hypothetical protein